MRKLAPVFSVAAVAWMSLCISLQATAQSTDQAPASAQTTTGAAAPTSDTAPHWTGGGVSAAQANQAANQPRYVHYLSLEHRTPEQVSSEDHDLLQARSKSIADTAEIYGYDLSQSGWAWDQAICPAFPGTVMVHYLKKYPDGSESLFTALVPRGNGRVRVVPALHRNAADYLPSVKDPHHYSLFNELVPADIAKQDASPEGKWLVLGVCYAEMVGGRPNVPDDPSLDVAMIRAPASTFRVDSVAKTREIQFPDREGQDVLRSGSMTLNEDGRLTSATSEDYATYIAHVVKFAEPAGTVTPNPPEPAPKIITPTVQPTITVTNPPQIPHP